MAEFCDRVLEFGGGVHLPALRTDRMRRDAVLRNLALIGEAATHIPDDLRAAYPEVPWRLVIGTRNRLIHGYLGIDDDTVASIVSTDVPRLRDQLAVILATASPP